jgi:ABC-type sugar transport system ATPase subunit
MEEVLRAEHLSKQFPGVLAVDDVSFTLNKGEILALVGENGAGKSTLSLILSGIHRPDSGTIYLEGKPVSFNAPVDAIRAGIAIVFQELSLVGSLSVAENIFANRQPVGAIGTIRWDELYRQTQEFLSRFNLRLNPRQLVKHLSMGQQQILEILKAISINPKVLILDEPTSSLTESEAGYLFENIRKLQKQGENLVAPSLPAFTKAQGLLDFRRIEGFAQQAARDYDIVTPSLTKKVSNLSGGNQQKCLIAMWMGINPRVILFDEPTRGVDVGARAEIYHKLRELSQSGVGIVMISSDLPELIGMCDRILVMHQGRITGELSREEFSEERIMTYAAGLQTQVSLEVNHG